MLPFKLHVYSSFKKSAFSRKPAIGACLYLYQYAACCLLNSSAVIESKDPFFLDLELTLWLQGILLELNLSHYPLYLPHDNLQFSF